MRAPRRCSSSPREATSEFSADDIETLKNLDRIADYGEHSAFPVFAGDRN